ncbi:Gfo/Idh/MocA family protein [Nonomuraea solani]|nr:Gfo/Idh/MocA family oxidoreductase [Nonomuraea solani]
MNPINVVIVGCGLIAGRWIRALSADRRVTIAALVDVDREAATRLAQRSGLAEVPWFANLESALAANGSGIVAGIVVNLTPADLHAPHTQTALEQGWHVFTEKPLALHLDQARDLVQLAHRRELVLAVMSNRGHDRRFLAFRDLVHAAGAGPYTISQDMFVRLPAAGFRSQLTFPAVADLAVHAFDQIQQLIRAAPVSVHCTETPLPFLGAHCSIAAATVAFADGSVFTFRGGFTGSLTGMAHRTCADGHWRIDQPGIGWQWNGLDTVATFHDVDPDHPTITAMATPPDGHGPRITAMLDAVHGGPCLPDALGSIALLDAALRSARTGQPTDMTEAWR